MRRLMALALCAGVVAAPISVSIAQTETETDVAEFVDTTIDGRKTDMRQLTRAAKRGVERRA